MNTNSVKLFSFLSASPAKSWRETSQPFSFGADYNGYVVCHREHPWFGWEYDNVPVTVHGGLTFSKPATEFHVDEVELPEWVNDDYWVFGWDTMHFGDTPENWPEKRIEEENGRLYQQFYVEALKKMKDDNRSECGEIVQGNNGEDG